MCHTRYGSFPGNSHRPCGLTLPKGRDPSGLPAADKTCLPSVGAAAPIGTTFRRSCPYKIGGAQVLHFRAEFQHRPCCDLYALLSQRRVRSYFFLLGKRHHCPIASRSIPSKELDAVKPAERQASGSQRNASAAITSYTAFSPHRTSHSAKISSTKRAPLILLHAASRNLALPRNS